MAYTAVTGFNTNEKLFSRKKQDEINNFAAPVLPLAKNYFPSIEITTQMTQEFEMLASMALDDAIRQRQRDHQSGAMDQSWSNLGDRNGFKRYMKEEASAQSYRLRGRIPETLANVMSVLYTKNDEQLLERRKRFYGDGLDAQTLCVLQDRTSQNPNSQLSIRWGAFQGSTVYDYVVLEYTGVTADLSDNFVGYKVEVSIDVQEVPSLKKTHGLTRLRGAEVMLLRPSRQTSQTEIYIDKSYDISHKMTTFVADRTLAKVALCLSNIPNFTHERYVRAMPLIHVRDMIAPSDRKSCYVCLQKFGMLSKKINCQSCGDIVCKSCIVTPLEKNEVIKFCKKCIVIASNKAKIVLTDRDRQQSYGGCNFEDSLSSSNSFVDNLQHDISTASQSSHISLNMSNRPKSTKSQPSVELSPLTGLESRSLSDSKKSTSPRFKDSVPSRRINPIPTGRNVSHKQQSENAKSSSRVEMSGSRRNVHRTRDAQNFKSQDDSKLFRDGYSLTSSEGSSYRSTVSRESGNIANLRMLPRDSEASVISIDTSDMIKEIRYEPYTPDGFYGHTNYAYQNGPSLSRNGPSMAQNRVEDSIAQQRHLLQEMTSKLYNKQ